MIRLTFGEYEIELIDESSYTHDSVDNTSNYELVYQDEESKIYQSTNHGIKVFKDENLYKSAVICATGGVTGIHENSAVIVDEDVLVCCADKIFSLALPDLRLYWMKRVDEATCFRIFHTENGIFVHGEINASRIDKSGDKERVNQIGLEIHSLRHTAGYNGCRGSAESGLE